MPHTRKIMSMGPILDPLMLSPKADYGVHVSSLPVSLSLSHCYCYYYYYHYYDYDYDYDAFGVK